MINFKTWLENEEKDRLEKLKEKAKTRSPVPQTLTSRNRTFVDRSKYNRKEKFKKNYR